MSPRGAAVLIFVFASPGVWAQAVISARSGTVNYLEGEVRLAGEAVKLDGASFPEVKPGQTLSTQMGHAEILLTPGVFLRLGRNASFRMISNNLTDTLVEVLSGSALVESDDLIKPDRIVVKMGDSEALLLKNGNYYFDAEARQIRAFDGKAQVSEPPDSIELKGGRAVSVGSALTSGKFDRKRESKDELYAWSARRSFMLDLSRNSATRGRNSTGFNNGSFDLGACKPGPGDALPCPPARP